MRLPCKLQLLTFSLFAFAGVALAEPGRAELESPVVLRDLKRDVEAWSERACETFKAISKVPLRSGRGLGMVVGTHVIRIGTNVVERTRSTVDGRTAGGMAIWFPGPDRFTLAVHVIHPSVSAASEEGRVRWMKGGAFSGQLVDKSDEHPSVMVYGETGESLSQAHRRFLADSLEELARQLGARKQLDEKFLASLRNPEVREGPDEGK